ncbi:Retrotransposon gag protein, partial [Macrophomina phaseolina MS6]
MEKLFRDTFVEERDRVWLATHHLDGEAYRWWLDFQEHPSTDLAAITWTRFKELPLAHYFPTSVKRKMEQDLRSLRQGDRTVAEYEREFSRLLHCVPFVVRDDEDKARIFERGLRPSIFRFVQSSNLQTYREVVDRALIVESGAAEVQEQRDARDK